MKKKVNRKAERCNLLVKEEELVEVLTVLDSQKLGFEDFKIGKGEGEDGTWYLTFMCSDDKWAKVTEGLKELHVFTIVKDVFGRQMRYPL